MKEKLLILSIAIYSVTIEAQTVGYVPKYLTTTTFNNSALFQSGTNFGIGTTTPDAGLMIRPTCSQVAGLKINFSAACMAGTGSPDAIIVNNTILNPIRTDFIVKGGTGLTGIGTATPTAQLEIKNTNANNAVIKVTSTTNTNLLYMNNSGNIGIGTTTPIAKLHLEGTAYINGMVGIGNYTGTTQLEVYNLNPANAIMKLYTTSQNYALVVNNDGNIGINRTNPMEKLDVNGNIKLNNNSLYLRGDFDYNHGLRWCGSTNTFAGNTTVDGPVLFGWSGGILGTTQSGNQKAVLSWASDGKVSIGSVTTPGDYSLYVEKGILAERFRCAIKTTADWQDGVFDKRYNLKTIKEVEDYIMENKHLPDVPSAEQVVCDGIDMAKMDATLLKKIEELTLYLIEQKKEIDFLKSRNKENCGILLK